jgi:hypothetical protein
MTSIDNFNRHHPDLGRDRLACVAGGAQVDRRFPPPWSVEEHPACFVVRDHNGQKLAYVYFEEEPGRRSAVKLLTKMRQGALQ